MAGCYSLDTDCPPKDHVFKTWFLPLVLVEERTYEGKSYWNKVLLFSACSPKEYGDTLEAMR